MSSRPLACAIAFFALACSKREETPMRQRGLTPTEAPAGKVAPPVVENSEPAQPSSPSTTLPSPFINSAPDPGALSAEERNTGAQPSAPGTARPAAAAEPAADAAPERDLPRELALLIGQPLSCVNLPAVVAGGGRLDIAVAAQVVPSGRITRAEASAAGQPPEALRCIEKLATSRSLKGPVPDAPRQVSTSVSMQVVATPP
jgi:hypothetical protein